MLTLQSMRSRRAAGASSLPNARGGVTPVRVRARRGPVGRASLGEQASPGAGAVEGVEPDALGVPRMS